MLELLHTTADPSESKALHDIIPGVIVQEKYPAPAGMQSPIEVKLQTVWGKTYMGVFWKGYRENNNREYNPNFEDNAWVVPDKSGGWAVKFASYYGNKKVGQTGPTHNELAAIIMEHMPAMVDQAEYLTKKLGASFLRVDFFLPPWRGSSLKLNEVAYGSGIWYSEPGLVPYDKDNLMYAIVPDESNLGKAIVQGYAERHKRMNLPSASSDEFLHAHISTATTFLSKLGLPPHATYKKLSSSLLVSNELHDMPVLPKQMRMVKKQVGENIRQNERPRPAKKKQDDWLCGGLQILCMGKVKQKKQ